MHKIRALCVTSQLKFRNCIISLKNIGLAMDTHGLTWTYMDKYL